MTGTVGLIGAGRMGMPMVGHLVRKGFPVLVYDTDPGKGFFDVLTATATGATSITGTVAGADAAVLLNEYRNFQIRIVEDTVTPTAVGQRRNITSHTAGASP